MTTPIDDAADEADPEEDGTASEMALRLLRRDLVSGAFKPDSKLKLRVLKERYGIGGSPMREALAQLTAQGLVRQLSQKGFRVPPLSATHLLDITRSRQLVEGEAVKLAIAHGDAAWEDEIVTSFHLLERMFLRMRAAKLPDVDEFETRHQRFHRALIAACPLRAITDFCEQLYVQATRYRVLLRRYAFTPESLVAEHRILMAVVLERKRSEAAEALRAHIGLTADVLRGEFTDWPAGTPGKRASASTGAGARVQASVKGPVRQRRRTR
jgi:GntR family transcriptional regulator, carbon starvation induced regulator